MSILKKISLLTLVMASGFVMVSGFVSAGTLDLGCKNKEFDVGVNFELGDSSCVLDRIIYPVGFISGGPNFEFRGESHRFRFVTDNVGDILKLTLTCSSDEGEAVNTSDYEIVADGACINGSQESLDDLLEQRMDELVEQRNEASETLAERNQEQLEACEQVDSQACFDAQSGLRSARFSAASLDYRIAGLERLEICDELGEDSEGCLDAREVESDALGRYTRISHLIGITGRLLACEDAGDGSEQCRIAQEQEARQKAVRIDLGDSEDAIDEDVNLIESGEVAIVDDNE